MSKLSRRMAPQINASSMADIAFLLLIFFLVTTTVEVDKGILQVLPRWVDINDNIKRNERNVLEILVNNNDALMIDGHSVEMNQIREVVKGFVTNNGDKPDWSESPRKAIVSLQNDEGTSYGSYLAAINEVKAAYTELRNAYALEKFQISYIDMQQQGDKYKTELDEVRAAYPYNLSEATKKEDTN